MLDRPALLAIAVDAVRQASHVTRAVQKTLVTADAMEKKDRSPVTVADFASQAVVCHHLARHSPDVPIVAEEDAADLRGEGQATLRSTVVEQIARVVGSVRETQALEWIDLGAAEPASDRPFWTLDPIDGTKGFLRHEQYAVALALVEGDAPVVAALACPNLPGQGGDEPGTLLAAVRGEPTIVLPIDGEGLDQSRPARVCDVTDPAAARFCESVEASHSDQGLSARIAESLGISAPPVRMDSQAKYAALARGDASIYMRLPTREDYRECIWDHAAGALVIEAAGGRVTDIAGRALDFSNGRRLERNTGILATNGHIHEPVLAAIDAASQPQPGT